MQNLEAAMAVASDSGSLLTLKSRIEAAEQGGVAHRLVSTARRSLQRLQTLQLQEILDVVLAPHSEWDARQQIDALQSALDHIPEAFKSKLKDDQEMNNFGNQEGTMPALADAPPSSAHFDDDKKQVRMRILEGKEGADSLGRDSSASEQPSITAGDDVQCLKDDKAPSALPVPLSEASDAATYTSEVTSKSERAGGSMSKGSLSDAESSGKDEALTLLNLARRARIILAAKKQDVAFAEQKRQEAERKRREAEAREWQEKQKLEEERAQKDRKERAEREKQLVAKKEACKHEKQVEGSRRDKHKKGNRSVMLAFRSSRSSHRGKELKPEQRKPTPDYLAAAKGRAALDGRSKAETKQGDPTVPSVRGTMAPPYSCGVFEAAAQQHHRSHSLEVLGEPTTKLNTDVLRVLDMEGEGLSYSEESIGTPSILTPYSSDPPLDGGRRTAVELDFTPKEAHAQSFANSYPVRRDQGPQFPAGASSAMTYSQSLSDQNNLDRENMLENNRTSQPSVGSKFGFVDLGGASWGVDGSACSSFSNLQAEALASSRYNEGRSEGYPWGEKYSTFEGNMHPPAGVACAGVSSEAAPLYQEPTCRDAVFTTAGSVPSYAGNAVSVSSPVANPSFFWSAPSESPAHLQDLHLTGQLSLRDQTSDSIVSANTAERSMWGARNALSGLESSHYPYESNVNPLGEYLDGDDRVEGIVSLGMNTTLSPQISLVSSVNPSSLHYGSHQYAAAKLASDQSGSTVGTFAFGAPGSQAFSRDSIGGHPISKGTFTPVMSQSLPAGTSHMQSYLGEQMVGDLSQMQQPFSEEVLLQEGMLNPVFGAHNVASQTPASMRVEPPGNHSLLGRISGGTVPQLGRNSSQWMNTASAAFETGPVLTMPDQNCLGSNSTEEQFCDPINGPDRLS